MTHPTETPALDPNLPRVPAQQEHETVSGGGSPVLQPRKRAGLFEWVLRRRAIAEAREKVVHTPTRRRELHRNAKLAQELAHRTLEPVDPLRAGEAPGLAAELYRQAAYWALNTVRPDLQHPSARELWQAADSSLLLTAAGGNPEELALVQQLFVGEPAFVLLSELPAPQQADAARALRRFSAELLKVLEQPQRVVERLELQRLYRSVVVLSIIAVLAAGAAVGVDRATRRPDIAVGVPWRTSSTWAICHPEIPDCGGSPTRIFFHTNNDDNPWFEYDFGKPTQFSALTLKNRSDYGPDRAIPLVVEVSNDSKTYTEVARRTETFGTWKVQFAPQNARYLRLRVLKVTPFHLEAVRVHK